MKCGIVNCKLTDNRYLWRCFGSCNRHFHAACVGAQRLHEEVLRTFMLPLCQDCQENFTSELNLKQLAQSFTNIKESLESSLAANHKLQSNFETLSAIHDETLERVEKLFDVIKQNITLVNTNSKNSATAINNQLKILHETPIALTKAVEKVAQSAAEAAAKEIMSTHTPVTQPIDPLPTIINAVRNDLATLTKSAVAEIASSQRNSHSTLELPHLISLSKEILDEVKSVSAVVEALDNSVEKNSPQTNKTLAEELTEVPQKGQSSSIHPSAPNTPKRDVIAELFAERRTKMRSIVSLTMQKSTSNTLASERNVIAELFNERRSKFRKLSSIQNKQESSDSGWRMVGNGSKKVFRKDWSIPDAKTAEKVSPNKRHRKQNPITNNNNENNNNNNTTKNKNVNIQSKNNKNNNTKTDKQLLDMAKTQFSSPPESTDHPIAALSVPAAKSFITFKKGETINQQPSAVHHQQQSTSNQQHLQQQHQKQQQQQMRESHIQRQSNPNMPQHSTGKQTNDIHSLPSTINADGQFELDPMRPPIVRLTQQSVLGDGRFLKARLRDPKIMKIVRLYLAYMKDQPATVCVEGMTPTSIRMLLASEGLPTVPEHLNRIFIEVHQEYGVNASDAAADLHSYGRFLASERTSRLQHLRESASKFNSPVSHFRK